MDQLPYEALVCIGRKLSMKDLEALLSAYPKVAGQIFHVYRDCVRSENSRYKILFEKSALNVTERWNGGGRVLYQVLRM